MMTVSSGAFATLELGRRWRGLRCLGTRCSVFGSDGSETLFPFSLSLKFCRRVSGAFWLSAVFLGFDWSDILFPELSLALGLRLLDTLLPSETILLSLEVLSSLGTFSWFWAAFSESCFCQEAFLCLFRSSLCPSFVCPSFGSSVAFSEACFCSAIFLCLFCFRFSFLAAFRSSSANFAASSLLWIASCLSVSSVCIDRNATMSGSSWIKPIIFRSIRKSFARRSFWKECPKSIDLQIDILRSCKTTCLTKDVKLLHWCIDQAGPRPASSLFCDNLFEFDWHSNKDLYLGRTVLNLILYVCSNKLHYPLKDKKSNTSHRVVNDHD